MAIDRNVQDFAQDTASTLVGTNRFIMYDEDEGRTLSLTELLKYIDQNEVVITAEYSPTQAYSVGDFCMHNGTLYKCTTAITAEAWNASHWQASTIGTTNGVVIY